MYPTHFWHNDEPLSKVSKVFGLVGGALRADVVIARYHL